MSASSPAERLRIALDMFAVGEDMMRARLRRDNPDLDDDQVEEAIGRWLRERPGAEAGDYPGPPSSRVLGASPT